MAKTTATQVALAAGVSAATVDRVLNGRGGVTAAKERAVLDAARRLGLDRALDQRPARTLRIAVLTQPPGNPFHAAISRSFEAEARSNPQINIQFRIHHIDPGNGRSTAARIAALASEHDGIVLVAAYDPDIGRALRIFSDAAKPVVALATDICASIPHIYVGPDNYRAGRVAGDLMGRLLGPDGGQVIAITGVQSMSGQQERAAGFRDVLTQRHPRVHIAAIMESHEDADRAGDLAYLALKQDAKVAGIYNASAGAIQIVDALDRLDRGDKTVFITHELTEERRALLQRGRIDAIIDQDPAHEVHVTVAMLAAHFGRAPKILEGLITPVHIHMVENC